MIQAVAFEIIGNEGKYAADGIEMAFEGDENGFVEELEKALLVIRNDFLTPTEQDIEEFYTFMSSLKTFDYKEFRDCTKEIEVQITDDQLKIIRERNDW